MDPFSPIAVLIEANFEYYNFIVNKRAYKKAFINDIYDGKLLFIEISWKAQVERISTNSQPPHPMLMERPCSKTQLL